MPMGSTMLTCAYTARLHGLRCTQHRLGGSWRSLLSKGILFPYPVLGPSLPYQASQIYISYTASTNLGSPE